MLLGIHIVLFVLIILTFRKIIRTNYSITPISGFLVGVVYFIYIPLLLLFFEGTHEVNMISGAKGVWTVTSLDNLRIYEAYTFLLFTLLLIFLIVLLMPFSPKTKLDTEKLVNYYNENKQKILFVYLSSVFALIIDITYNVSKAGGVEAYFNQHWYHKHADFFNEYGAFAVIVSKFNQANLIVFTAVSIILSISWILNLREHSNLKMRLVVISGLSTNITLHLLVILTHGNRIYFALYLILLFFMLVVLKMRKIYLGLIMVSPILMIVFSMWSYTRSSLNSFFDAAMIYFNSFSNLNNPLFNIIYDITEGTNVLISLNLIDHFDSTSDFFNGLSYLKLIRPLFPDYITYIDSFNVIVGELYMPGTNVSLNSTMFGEMYGNFGKLSVAVALSITLILIVVSFAIKNNDLILNMIICVLVVWFARSVFSDNLILFSFSMIWYITLNMIFRYLSKVSNIEKTRRRITIYEQR